MEILEAKAIPIQTQMYDSVAHTFDRVSGQDNNGTTSLQGQHD